MKGRVNENTSSSNAFASVLALQRIACGGDSLLEAVAEFSNNNGKQGYNMPLAAESR